MKFENMEKEGEDANGEIEEQTLEMIIRILNGRRDNMKSILVSVRNI